MPFYSPAGVGSIGFETTAGMPLPLKVAVLDKAQERKGRTTAVLLERFGYEDSVERLKMEVPASFVTDFASIPDWARAVLSPYGRHAKAAVLHDWMYAVGERGLRETADRIFLHAMADLGVERWARDLMFNAVQLGGGDAWKRAAKDWPHTFADQVSGDVVTPPFARADAFVGAAHGPVRI